METKMTIENDKGKVVVMKDAKSLGQLDFILVDGVMVIDHTRSFEKGIGVGKSLVVAAIEYAKKHNLKINPVCSYAYSVMVRNDEYKNLMTDSAEEGVSCKIW